jgi:hypothetical protein
MLSIDYIFSHDIIYLSIDNAERMSVMQINQAKFNKVVEPANAKTNDQRWLKAIDKASVAILNGQWTVTELMDSCLITMASGET